MKKNKKLNMTLNTNNIKKNIFNCLLILLGFFLVMYYIWFRFIRERLPRDIPFNLTFINFFIF